ncbi:MAG: PAS domain-containing sensor histidine kinase [Minisyncoccota bacterium]
MAQSTLGGVLSFVAEGTIVFTPEGVITLVNPHASLLLDRTTDELVGKRIDDVFALTFDSEPLLSEERITYTLFTAKKIFTVPRGKVAYLTSKSGNRFPVFVSARSLILENGLLENGLAGILVFRDISNEKKLEHYKTNTAKRLSELTPILQRIAVGDFSDAPEVPGQEDEFTELLVGLHLMVEDLREAQIQTQEYSERLKKQVEEKTREVVQARTHIEAIIENLTVGLLEYDDQCILLRINRTAEALLGIDRGEVVGKKILSGDGNTEHWKSLVDVLYPQLSPTVKMTKYTTPQFDVEMNEITIRYPLERELQIITVPIAEQEDGNRRGFLKLVRDITRERNIAKSKSEFISIAAHQLRTPLSTVKWTLDMVLGGDEGALNAAQDKFLRNCYETNEKMIKLVNDLLNVARIEEGRFGYEFKQDDIMAVIQNATAFVKGTAEEKGVTVSVETPGGKPPLLVFDAGKVTLALQNLVDNAVKYTPAGGRVTVRVAVQGEYLEVSVHDTGIGVPQKQIDKLFTKFFRADNAIRTQVSGSGMGLYLAKNVAARHGGSLQVESKEGAGSTFTFKLPLQADRIPQSEVSLVDV